MLGDEMPVPTTDGRKLMLTITPETQNGRLFRLANKGMPLLRSQGNGTLFARGKVILPMGLTSDQRSLFEQLARTPGATVHSYPAVQVVLDEACGPPPLARGAALS